MSDGTIKQVRVDNWGIFFLQRLQQLFSKSEQCDLVLHFSTNEKIKVHRLVLNACTEYFQMLEKQGFVIGDCLRMPHDLQADVVLPIINFMYTGRLEFRTELHKRLYTTAQQMNMTVLTKLLDAQNAATSPQVKPIIRRPPQVPITYNLQGKKIVPKQIDTDLPETLPGRKLPIWKRRNVPSNVPTYFEDSSSIGDYDSSKRMSTVAVDESPRPTRFDWPEVNVDTSSYTSSFDDLSYETKPLLKPSMCTDNRPPVPKVDTTQKVATFEEVCRTATNMKRMPSSGTVHDEVAAKKAKILDLQAVKEYVEEHRLRKDLLDTTDENGEEVDDDLAVADLDDDDDDMEDDDAELSFEELSGQQEEEVSLEQSQPLSTTAVLPPCASPVLPSPPPQPVQQVTLPPQKSILKPQASHEDSVPSTPVSVASKKVRFLLDATSAEGKENAATVASAPKVQHSDDGQRPLPTRADNITAIGGTVSNAGNLSNHAKIITEVLKKYPHLVKNNKNIRLKIMQRGGAQVTPVVPMDGDASKMVKSKVSYVVLKSDVVGKGKPAVVLKHGVHVEPLSELGGQKLASGAENTTGPWLCHSCGSNEEPVHFETYYLYRRHLQDVHMEKIDARICEHCGHRASKRNLLLYHLYTKHGVPPPRNCQFPKCDQCDYVALSESLLIKHRNNHSNNKEFVCKVCNATFKSNGALQGHMQTNLHSDPAKKLYECPFCQKPFVRNINLKAHIRTSHKEVIRKMDEEEKLHMEAKHKQFANLQHFEDGEEAHSSDAMGEDSLNADEEEEGEVMEVPVIDAVVQKPGTGTVILPSGVTVLAEAPAVQSLVPSSEAEALSNVASGIAASLGLTDTLTGEQTVIVLDDNQEFILHSTEVVGEEITSTDGKDVVDVSDVGIGELQEYIVPEIMPDEGQEHQDQSYTGPLSDLAHYSGEANPTLTVASQQTATAPPPVSVAVSVVGGDEVTMVLTDHDYAPMRDTSVEGMMFLITQPTEQTEEHDMKCPVRGLESEPQLPVLEKEPPPPELTAESPCAMPADIKYSNIPPILTREIIPHGVREPVISADEQMISDSVISERNTDGVTVIEEIPPATEGSIQELSEAANNQESQVEHVEGLAGDNNIVQEIGTDERWQEEKVIMASSVEGLRQKEVSETKESKSEEQKEQEVVTEETGGGECDDIDDEGDESNQASAVKTYSPVKKPVVSNAPIRRQPPVQMADIMKEWDDFDYDENDSSEPCHRFESEIRPDASEEEPKVLRGPVSEDR